MATTKAEQKAVNKYIKNNYDRVNLTMPKGKKEEHKNHAKELGFDSLNSYIMDCIENEKIFKAFSRMLLRDLKDIKEALQTKDYDKAEKMIDVLIEDTQKDIENWRDDGIW